MHPLEAKRAAPLALSDSYAWLRLVIAAIEIAQFNGCLIPALCAMDGITLDDVTPRARPAGKSMGKCTFELKPLGSPY
jgi:hypothetical protein